jgi:serralysin
VAIIIGNDQANSLFGTAEADWIRGFGGNDRIKGGGGADFIDGGAGIDTASYITAASGVSVNLQSGTGYAGDALGDTLISIENVEGSHYADSLVGNDVANVLTGFDGADSLFGNGGADVLEGGAMGDLLCGGSGGDLLNGGEGYDAALYIDSATGVFVSLISDYASGGTADGDDLNDIECVYGSDFADNLWGDNGTNTLWGFNGNDSLKGYGGADYLEGFDGNDTLRGMDGNDRIGGGIGNDILDGGAGADVMRGDEGADTFLWNSIGDVGLTAATCDVVADFSLAQGDRIDLRGIDANVYAAGDQAFRFIGTAAFSGRPGEINYYYADGDTYVQLQTGTSADIEGVIRFDGIVTPEASWFLL